MFCGDLCIKDYDLKHPSRWRRVVLCRTADCSGKETFKKVILNVCDLRNDEWASCVKIRIQGAVSEQLMHGIMKTASHHLWHLV